MPWCHCCAASIQEARWNWISWPEALPRKNWGDMTRVAAAATQRSVGHGGSWGGASWSKMSRRRLELLDDIALLMSEAPRIQNRRRVRHRHDIARLGIVIGDDGKARGRSKQRPYREKAQSG